MWPSIYATRHLRRNKEVEAQSLVMPLKNEVKDTNMQRHEHIISSGDRLSYHAIDVFRCTLFIYFFLNGRGHRRKSHPVSDHVSRETAVPCGCTSRMSARI